MRGTGKGKGKKKHPKRHSLIKPHTQSRTQPHPSRTPFFFKKKKINGYVPRRTPTYPTRTHTSNVPDTGTFPKMSYPSQDIFLSWIHGPINDVILCQILVKWHALLNGFICCNKKRKWCYMLDSRLGRRNCNWLLLCLLVQFLFSQFNPLLHICRVCAGLKMCI